MTTTISAQDAVQRLYALSDELEGSETAVLIRWAAKILTDLGVDADVEFTGVKKHVTLEVDLEPNDWWIEAATDGNVNAILSEANAQGAQFAFTVEDQRK